MTFPEEIMRGLDEIASHREKITDETDEGVFNNLTFHLGKLEESVREYTRQSTAEEVTAVIDRLSSGEPLSKDDLEMIRLWIIGDAEHYVGTETDYPNWLAELDRLLGIMAEIRGDELTIENIGRLSGAIREAMRVIGDIIYFKGQQERIARFNRAMDRLEADDKRMIAGVLKDKLRSPRM